MARNLDTANLEMAAHDYATHLLLPTAYSKAEGYEHVAVRGREWVLQNFYNLFFKDDFDYLLNAIKAHLGPATLVEFEKEAAVRYTPRDDAVFASLLAEKLAITPDGNHIPGKIGTTQYGSRVVGERITRHGKRIAQWPIYAGEEEERALGNVRAVGEDGPGMDPIPPEDTLWWNETDHMGHPSVLMALSTNVSIAFAQAAINQLTVNLDEGSVAGMIEGRSTPQPPDPDGATTGTLLFDLVLTDPAFPGATDAAPGALITANSIAPETSASAGTLLYCRASSSNVLQTALNSHIDGEAQVGAGSDFDFNTLAIAAGATVDITSWTVTLPQGPDAT